MSTEQDSNEWEETEYESLDWGDDDVQTDMTS